MTQSLSDFKRIVIKIGSALLVDPKLGTIHQSWLQALCEDIAKLRQQGTEVVIVSSGSIAIGKRYLDLKTGPLLLEQQQAAAATGQVRLMQAYQALLAEHDIAIAQILLTLDDSENRKRYINARNTIETLLDLNVVPIINENDTVATSEIRYGDNDRLSARVAQMTGADALVLLSDIDGLYTADPRQDKTATLIPQVEQISAEILAMAGDSGTQFGSGGMKTKLAAANIVMASGCRMVICNGRALHPISQLESGAACTWFIPALSPKNARKTWLAQHLKPRGSVTIDAGAVKALGQGRSLLSVGVLAVTGQFSKGDPVSIQDEAGKELARGLMNYPAHEATLIKGAQSKAIQSILGYCGSDEMIHRNDLVLLGE